MNWNTAIPIICVVITCGVVLWHFTTDPSVPSDPGKETRDSLRQVARAKELQVKVWMDSAAYFKRINDSLSAIPPSVIIDDAVHLTRNASIDSVRAILLARPE